MEFMLGMLAGAVALAVASSLEQRLFVRRMRTQLLDAIAERESRRGSLKEK